MMVLRFQRVAPIVSHHLTTPNDRGVTQWAQQLKPIRENRTITVDFRDEATFMGDGKAFLECVLAFVLALGFPHSTRFSGKGYHRSSKAPNVRICRLRNQSRVRMVPPLDFHPTLAGMLSPTLIRD